MTFDELKERVIFQVNADSDDLDDYEPALDGYINAGYDQIVEAFLDEHLNTGNFYVSLAAPWDVPIVPEWTHIAIADYATYLVYRNGNPQKQQRGQQFLMQFNDILSKCKALRGKIEVDSETGAITVKSKKPPQFFNVYL